MYKTYKGGTLKELLNQYKRDRMQTDPVFKEEVLKAKEEKKVKDGDSGSKNNPK